MQRNETFHNLLELLVPKQNEADTVQGEMVRSLSHLNSEFDRNGNRNWAPSSGQGQDSVYFQELMSYLWASLTDKPSNGFLQVFDADTIQQIKRDLGHLNLVAIMVTLLPVPQQIWPQILAASHTDSEAVIWQRLKAYFDKWLQAHAALHDKRVDAEIVQVKEAFHELHVEWSVHANTGWISKPDMFGEYSGAAYYQAFIDYLWRHLMSGDKALMDEFGFVAPQNCKNSFNKSEMENISRDLVFINLLGYLHGFMRVDNEQGALILEATLPQDLEEVVFARLETRIIQWCQMNPKLFARQAEDAKNEVLSKSLPTAIWFSARKSRSVKTPRVSTEMQKAYSQILEGI